MKGEAPGRICPALLRPMSAQEIVVVIILVVQVGEIILGALASAEGRAVLQLLQVVEAAGDATVAVGFVGEGGHRDGLFCPTLCLCFPSVI